MHGWIALLFFLAQPFWETKSPEQWSDREIDLIRIASPWTQTIGPQPNLLVWLATARPLEEAESEARLHRRNPLRQPDPDYLNFLADNREKIFVLAIAYPTLNGLGKEADAWKAVEKETAMRVGSKSYKIEGLFPPEPSDQVLRLIFPRVVKPGDKSIEFQLYLPGLPFPERSVDFHVKDLSYHGNLAM
jgi:hypothetical protein